MSKTRQKRNVMDWENWYLLAAHYYDTHGDLLVPRDYVCPDGEKLGRWIERQRAKYNRVPTIQGRLDSVQIEYLEQIGMVWKLEHRRGWDEWLRVLDRYAALHGDIDVPHDVRFEGYGLGDWLVKQRLRYAAGELTEREIADLEARGVRWSLRTRPRSWDAWFADAEAYYRQHGDLMVPLDALTPAGDKLGFWIYRQRDIYMGRKKGLRLTQEQVEKLAAIGMVWDPLALRADAWERMYAWVLAYRNENAKLPLWPRDLKAPDGRSMGAWIRAQRQGLALGKIPPERAAKLNAIGIRPAERSH